MVEHGDYKLVSYLSGPNEVEKNSLMHRITSAVPCLYDVKLLNFELDLGHTPVRFLSAYILTYYVG